MQTLGRRAAGGRARGGPQGSHETQDTAARPPLGTQVLGRRAAGGEARGGPQDSHETQTAAARPPLGAQALGWCASVVALVGYVLVLAFPGRGWALVPWAVSNPVFVILNLRAGLPWQALLFAVYALGTFWGLWRWRHGS